MPKLFTKKLFNTCKACILFILKLPKQCISLPKKILVLIIILIVLLSAGIIYFFLHNKLVNPNESAANLAKISVPTPKAPNTNTATNPTANSCDLKNYAYLTTATINVYEYSDNLLDYILSTKIGAINENITPNQIKAKLSTKLNSILSKNALTELKLTAGDWKNKNGTNKYVLEITGYLYFSKDNPQLNLTINQATGYALFLNDKLTSSYFTEKQAATYKTTTIDKTINLKLENKEYKLTLYLFGVPANAEWSVKSIRQDNSIETIKKATGCTLQSQSTPTPTIMHPRCLACDKVKTDKSNTTTPTPAPSQAILIRQTPSDTGTATPGESTNTEKIAEQSTENTPTANRTEATASQQDNKETISTSSTSTTQNTTSNIAQNPSTTNNTTSNTKEGTENTQNQITAMDQQTQQTTVEESLNNAINQNILEDANSQKSKLDANKQSNTNKPIVYEPSTEIIMEEAKESKNAEEYMQHEQNTQSTEKSQDLDNQNNIKNFLNILLRSISHFINRILGK